MSLTVFIYCAKSSFEFKIDEKEDSDEAAERRPLRLSLNQEATRRCMGEEMNRWTEQVGAHKYQLAAGNGSSCSSLIHDAVRDTCSARIWELPHPSTDSLSVRFQDKIMRNVDAPCFCKGPRGRRGCRANKEREKTRKLVQIPLFTRAAGHQLVFLAECKDAAVSCVIIEPTYNHEREGRGNFVAEGKSGEPLSLRTLLWVAARPPPPAAPAAAPPAPLTFMEQSMSAAAAVDSSSLAFSRFEEKLGANSASDLSSLHAVLHCLCGANHCTQFLLRSLTG